MNFSLKTLFKTLLAVVFLIVFNLGIIQPAQSRPFKNKTDTLHLLLIGNSFSQNASRYLPQLAEEGGHHLMIGRAELGGCSLQRHWELVKLAEANPSDPKAKPYQGKSLRMLLSERVWEIVTLQQYSMLSGDLETYLPYARNLYDFIKLLQPNAKIVFHQTWAYRSDSKDFGQIAPNLFAKSETEMWQKSRAAYQAVAKELGAKTIPVGDAFHKVNSGPKAFRKDLNFDEAKVVYPVLPNQSHSLNSGFYWDSNKKLNFDSHHANDAGCYLGALVWYTFLFEESPLQLKFAPSNVPRNFAAYLRKIAKSTVK